MNGTPKKIKSSEKIIFATNDIFESIFLIASTKQLCESKRLGFPAVLATRSMGLLPIMDSSRELL
jgi:hypothetical protein